MIKNGCTSTQRLNYQNPCSLLIHLSSKNCSVKMIIVKKLDVEVKKLTHSLCLEDKANKCWFYPPIASNNKTMGVWMIFSQLIQ